MNEKKKKQYLFRKARFQRLQDPSYKETCLWQDLIMREVQQRSAASYEGTQLLEDDENFKKSDAKAGAWLQKSVGNTDCYIEGHLRDKGKVRN